MIKKILIIVLLFFVFMPSVHAQNETDALRYSFITNSGGTARSMGMSGAFSALGADFSVLSTNPAGIGSFKKSRLMFSTGAIMMNSSTDYFGENTQDDFVKGNMNNIGAIISILPYSSEESEWKTVVFGVGYNFLQNFSNSLSFTATNSNSSFLDVFMLNSDGNNPNELSDWLWMAYDTYATDTIPNSENTYIHPLYPDYGEKQQHIIETKGGIGEYVFSLGGNYNNLIQIGATFGIQKIRSVNTLKHKETTQSGDFERFEYSEKITTKGSGYNLKFGMIISPVRFFRLAMAFHTPTFYTLKDVYSYSMDTYWRTPDSDGKTSYSSSAGEYEYAYEFYSPFKAIAGLAFVVSRYAILSADYEFVNYGKSRFRAEDYDFETENNAISHTYGAGHNFKAGMEIRLAPIYLRSGVSYYGSPTQKVYQANGSFSGYSLGLGLKTKSIYIDIAFNHSFTKNALLMYEYDPGQFETADYSFSRDQINFTLGYKIN